MTVETGMSSAAGERLHEAMS